MTAGFLMKPKIDFAFKEIMTLEEARIGFLSAMLKIRPEDIKETRILNTSLRKEHEDDKLGILDVRVLLNNAVEINVDYSDFRIIPTNLLKACFYKIYKQVYRNNYSNNLVQVGL